MKSYFFFIGDVYSLISKYVWGSPHTYLDIKLYVYSLYFLLSLTLATAVDETCHYGLDHYPVGAIFRPEPCAICHCWSGKNITCTYETCPDRPDPFCRRYEPAHPGRCCSRCAEYRGCEVDGERYAPGRKVLTGPCLRCFCPWQAGAQAMNATCVKLQCLKLDCPDQAVPRGQCCPVCTNGELFELSNRF